MFFRSDLQHVFSHARGLETCQPFSSAGKRVFSHARGLETQGKRR